MNEVFALLMYHLSFSSFLSHTRRSHICVLTSTCMPNKIVLMHKINFNFLDNTLLIADILCSLIRSYDWDLTFANPSFVSSEGHLCDDAVIECFF